MLIAYLLSYFYGNIYAVFSSKDSERGGDYWLERYIEGNQIINMLMINDEKIHFPIGLMVVKDECLTWDNNA